jgi:hypothetical protein
VLDELDVLPSDGVVLPDEGADPLPDDGFELEVDEPRSLDVVPDEREVVPSAGDTACEPSLREDSVVRSVSCARGAPSARGASRPNIANATTARTAADTIPSTSFLALLGRALTFSVTTASHPR